ncbi:alpha-crystallin B chain-like [Leguminivora glycinivorella]|uniref:alpha-crystallin B chain-like n=1 Tax=Leguminivora glycinivorella TaxID=1035111 RepID=UPI00200D5BED|nr:alpha-crystallin B chain-like [Leguminivora glycinivorella]
MHKYVALALLLVAAAQARKHHHKQQDPFAALDQQLSHSLAFHYLWPWSQLVQAAAAMDDEDNLEEPQITSDPNSFEINMNVKRFKPNELRIKVKNQYIIVEGRHRVTSDNTAFLANHFVQRFNLPPGTKQEEVKAVLKENGILSISAPRHEVPPPPPERIVPIEVRTPPPTSEKPTETPTDATTEKVETSSEKLETTSEQIATSSEKIDTTSQKVPEMEVASTEKDDTLLEFRLADKTHHVGKIRKKELKNTSKHVKDNEVSKGDGNALDYALIEAEE